MCRIYRFLLIVLCFFACSTGFSGAAEIVGGKGPVAPYRIAKLTATKLQPNAAVMWDYDRAAVDGYECGLNLFVVAKPGTYCVTLTAISVADGKPQVERDRVQVTFEGPPSPPVHPPSPPGKIDPLAARLKIVFGNAGCTATVIYPRRPDGKWDVFTAAHCIGSVGRKGQGRLPDGRVLPLTSVVVEKQSDIAWLVTDQPYADLPSAVLARDVPPPGTPIWHQGYGRDNPNGDVKRTGKVLSGPDASGTLWYQVRLSSGDSGSGIFRVDNGECVATVYGVSGGRSLGGSAKRAWELRPSGSWVAIDGKWERVYPQAEFLPCLTFRTLLATSTLPSGPAVGRESIPSPFPRWRPMPLPRLRLSPPPRPLPLPSLRPRPLLIPPRC